MNCTCKQAICECPLPQDTIETTDEILAIHSTQAAHAVVVDGLIEVYRRFDKTPRRDLKKMLKRLYEDVKRLGVAVGVSGFAMDHVWQG